MKKVATIVKGKLDNFLYSGFTTRKIKVEGVRQPKREIQVKYIESDNINEKNIIELNKNFDVKIYNYQENIKTQYGKSEKFFTPYQLAVWSMIIPSTYKTIQSIQGFNSLLSYRQARYIYDLRKKYSQEDTFYDLFLKTKLQNAC